MSERYNIPRDTTLKELVTLQKASLLGSSNTAAIDKYYNGLVLACTTKEQVDSLFREWWASQYQEGKTTKLSLLERWFGVVLDDDRIHGVKEPLFETSQTAIGELTDDSSGLSCTPSTAAKAGNDPFAHLPQFWCLEVSAEKAANGAPTIYAVEHIDDLNLVRSGEHLCWVLQKNTFTREWKAGGYKYLKMKCHPSYGYNQWPQGTDRTGTVHAFMANPKYSAGMKDGKVTCGTNLPPLIEKSHTAGVALWRARGSQYSGSSGNLRAFLLRMMRLKYARKGNSGTIEGCTSNSVSVLAAVSEKSTTRVVLTAANAASFYVGMCVNVGASNESDRSKSGNFSIAKLKKIAAIEDVTIGTTQYKAVYIDTDTAFDTVGGTTRISTMPYYSGWNDGVLGNDGSQISYTSGKEPGLIQKVEFMIGAYQIFSDELFQWGKNADGDFTLDIYTCHDQSKVSTSGAIDGNYTKQSDLTLVFPATQGNAWVYIADNAVAKDPAVLWPENVNTAAGSGTGVKDALCVGPASSGVRAAWCFGYLDYGGVGGVSCLDSGASVGAAYWSGSLGAPGLAG